MAEKFFFETFTNLMTISPAKALEYRDRCHQSLIEENQTKQEEIIEEKSTLKEDVNWLEIRVDDFTEDEVEFTRADLIEKLNTAWIKFMPNSKDETLLQKCITNNLI
jgi:hypothetical protein